jgi:uncharacterized glyoxalase superfamily protein PhnB
VPLSLLLRCEDITKTRDYYRDILHFDVIKGSELSLSVVKFSALIIFTELDLWQQNFQMSGTVYISVPDVDHYFSEVKDAAEIAWTLQDTRYGTREFAVRDCNGYCLAFMQNENDIKFKYVAK